MQHDQTPDSYKLVTGGVDDTWEVDDQGRQGYHVLVRPPTSYRHAFGDEPIRLGIVEFRILLFLANKPYHAFTRRQIADEITSHGLAISEDSVDGHIAILRDQLGILSDFVQTVPHVGYRYKA